MIETELEPLEGVNDTTLTDSDQNYSNYSILGHLNQKQVKVIEALLSTTSIEAASRQSGISVRTIRRYMNDFEFSSALAQAVAQSYKEFSTTLVQASLVSVQVLYDLATSPAVASGIRQRAAQSLIDARLRSLETALVQNKIELVNLINIATDQYENE